jgi:predicted Fe-Mo cluster-binding NifX family protein
MKICVPSVDDSGLDATVEAHFGRAACFSILDEDSDEVQVLVNDGEHHGGARTPAQIILESGADVVLASGMGPKAVMLLQGAGLRVCFGAQGTVRQAVDAYRDNRLPDANAATACKDHQHGA